jgi:hypothetical protein
LEFDPEAKPLTAWFLVEPDPARRNPLRNRREGGSTAASLHNRNRSQEGLKNPLNEPLFGAARRATSDVVNDSD